MGAVSSVIISTDNSHGCAKKSQFSLENFPENGYTRGIHDRNSKGAGNEKENMAIRCVCHQFIAYADEPIWRAQGCSGNIRNNQSSQSHWNSFCSSFCGRDLAPFSQGKSRKNSGSRGDSRHCHL